MPFTAMDVLTSYWPLGRNTEILAKSIRVAPTAVMYCSSMIIVLIAINCYRQILIRNSQQQLDPKRIGYLVIIIIGLSILISSPIAYYTKLNPLIDDNIKMALDSLQSTYETGSSVQSASSQNVSKPPIDNVGGNNKTKNSPMCRKYDDVRLSYITFVTEDWPILDDWSGNTRMFYSIMSLITQSILPFFVISYCYYSVYNRLKDKPRFNFEFW